MLRKSLAIQTQSLSNGLKMGGGEGGGGGEEEEGEIVSSIIQTDGGPKQYCLS